MCLYVGGGFFPRAAVLYDASAQSGGLFSREGLGSRDTKALPVGARIKIVLTQVTS